MKEAERNDWTVLCEDESIFLYDSVVRYIWAFRGSRPFILTTGSHRRTCVFGAVSIEGKQLFRQYQTINGRNFLAYLKALKRKFGKMLLFLDRSKAHRNDEIEHWLKANRKVVKVKWFPIARPELNPVEESWNLLKDELVANRLYHTFEEMKQAIAKRVRTKRFKLNMINYLC